MKSKKRMFLIMVMAFIAVLLAITGAKSYIESNLKSLTETPISDVDLSKIEDGNYIGNYRAFPVEAEVEVRIKDHRIEGIELKRHNNGQGSAAEVIPDKVTEAQTLDVDIVSGATYSSKVILKAIENALKNAVE